MSHDNSSKFHAELLVQLLGVDHDMARSLLERYPLHVLGRVPERKLAEILGGDQARKLRAAIAFSEALATASPTEGDVVLSSPEAIFRYCAPTMSRAQYEECRVIMVDTHYRVKHEVVVGIGNQDEIHISVNRVLTEVLQLGFNKFVLVHNHPSGDPDPSEEDLRFTERICEACYILGIKLVDHVVIGETSYRSIRGMIPYEFKRRGM